MAQKIREKDASVSLVAHGVRGYDPRHLTDLIGSLCDPTSGSGDKGTPVIYIQATSITIPTNKRRISKQATEEALPWPAFFNSFMLLFPATHFSSCCEKRAVGDTFFMQ